MARSRSSRSRIARLALLAAASLAAAPAGAGGSKDKAHEIAMIRAAVARGELAPLPRIMTIARSRVPGDVVKTELESEHGRLVYEVKILTASGRVREVVLDARTAAVLKVESD